MANLSNYFKNKMIDHMFRGQSFTPPATVYVALFTANTGFDSDAPSAEVSASGTGYSRKSLTLSAASGGASSNSAELDWGVATGAGFGTVTHVALVDHATNTNWGTNVNVLVWGALETPKLIEAGDVFKFLATKLGLAVS